MEKNMYKYYEDNLFLPIVLLRTLFTFYSVENSIYLPIIL